MSEFDFLIRTEALLGKSALEMLAGATVCVAGLGGVGGSVALTLARMGAGGLAIADPGFFDLPDLNRQAGAFRSTVGRNKAEVYEDLLPSVNPLLKLRVYRKGLTEDNVHEFLDGASLVIDCLDIGVPAPLRQALYKGIRERGIYVILPPIIGFGAIAAVASPQGMLMDPVLALLAKAALQGVLPSGLRSVFDDEVLKQMEQQMKNRCVPSIAVGPNLSAAVVSTEAAMILCKEAFPGWREPITLPQMIVIDLLRLRCRVMTIDEVAGLPRA